MSEREYSPPVSLSSFYVIPVGRLPRGEPFRVKGCMPERSYIRWRYRWARIRPRPTSECCWYHRGDWRRVNAVAIRLLTAATPRLPAIMTMDELDDLAAAVTDAADAEGIRGWERDALHSLFLDPIVLTSDDDEDRGRPWYVNGQHRSRAMRDAGVARTLTRCDELGT